MKSRLWTKLLYFTVLCSALSMASSVTAGKPVKPPPEPPEDSCSSSSFAPDFAFWRNTGTRKKPKATIYLAESDTACERSLIDVPYTENDWFRHLKFSSVEQDHFFGRVVWVQYGLDSSVWLQDFTIDGTEVVRLDEKQQLLHKPQLGPDENAVIYSIDLSPDTTTLAFEYYHDQAGSAGSFLRLLRIDDLGALTWACGGSCPFDVDIEGVALTLDELAGERSFMYPAWGPFGDRLYVRRSDYLGPSAPYSHSHAIQYYDLEMSSWPPTVDGPLALFSSLENPDYSWMRNPVSGIREGIEYLAIEKEPTANEACEYIYIIDVEACLENSANCFTEPAFAGRFPSWTRNGKILHEYSGWTINTGNCRYTDVGVWDGLTLRSLLDGKEPDAAGGVVE